MTTTTTPDPSRPHQSAQALNPPVKKRIVRRVERDRSQLVRAIFQVAFVLLNLWIGVEFYLWVRQYEPGGTVTGLQRPPGVEGWLPIAALMNLKYLLLTGHVPGIHPAGMFLLAAFIAISLLFRKAFCSWLCPVGTLSEYLWKFGRSMLGRNFMPPAWLDIPLRSLKYLMMGFFLWAVSTMSAIAIAQFMTSPYGVIADVKMLNFFRHIGMVGIVVLVALAVLSVFIQNFWCRYLCPYGALLGLLTKFSPVAIRRNENTCIDCAKCAKVCPSVLQVDKLLTVNSAECTGCLECVAACPVEDTLSLSLPVLPRVNPQRLKIPTWKVAVGIVVIFAGLVGIARAAGWWHTTVPDQFYQQYVPNADLATHPMP